MKKVLFIKNAFVLTLTSLVLRLLGVVVKIRLAAIIGSEGIGLYQLIFSVYALASTFAASGICTAVTRLVADELCVGSRRSIKHILSRAFLLTFIVAFFSASLLLFGAPKIALLVVGDLRAVLPLRILSLSLFFMGLSSCLRGYFIACRKTFPPASSQIIEQLIRIFCIMFHVKQFVHLGLEYACAAVFFADFLAEFLSFVYLFFLYSCNNKGLSYLSGRKTPNYAVTKKICRISAPITLGKYGNSLLRTIENSLVPRQLVLSGLEKSQALSLFGSIKGMALPILFFPSSLLNSLSTLLIPEICEATTKGQSALVQRTVERVIAITVLFGVAFAGVFFVCGEQIGVLVYKDAAVGQMIKLLAPIVPFMYLDSICDGILKALDQQNITFRNSILDSSSRIALILIFLPIFQINGFIGIMYFSNLLTCFLNLGRLLRVTRAKIQFFKKIVLPVVASSLSCFSACFLLHRLPLLFGTIVSVFFALLCYFLLLFLFGGITKKELRELF